MFSQEIFPPRFKGRKLFPFEKTFNNMYLQKRISKKKHEISKDRKKKIQGSWRKRNLSRPSISPKNNHDVSISCLFLNVFLGFPLNIILLEDICLVDLILGCYLIFADVLILHQFMSKTGTIIEREVTGLCARQHKRMEKLIKMAQKAGLMPHEQDIYWDRKQERPWERLNSYWDEKTIDTQWLENEKRSKARSFKS